MIHEAPDKEWFGRRRVGMNDRVGSTQGQLAEDHSGGPHGVLHAKPCFVQAADRAVRHLNVGDCVGDLGSRAAISPQRDKLQIAGRCGLDLMNYLCSPGGRRRHGDRRSGAAVR